jgi:hypothetical protein
MLSSHKTSILWLIFLPLMLGISVFFQYHYLSDRSGNRVINPECPWCEEDEREDVLYVPLSAPLMRIFSPADPHLLADLLWMRTTYYFGKHVLSDQEYPYLFHMLDLITDLSPDWLNPYFYGAVIFPSEAKAVEEGFYMVEKGLIHHPNSWELWFFKGYYLWKYFNNNIAASEALHTAANKPDAPIYLAKLAATLATKSGEKEIALRFLQESIKNTNDPSLKRILIKKLEEINNG